MKVLGIETATTLGGVAVADGKSVVAAFGFDAPNNHSSECALIVRRVLDEAGIQLAELDAVAVSIGPGSFTGLRVGLSLAKGLCMAGKIPLVPVPTLEALALGVGWLETPICVLLPARKGFYYVGLYRSNGEGVSALRDIEVLSAEELIAGVKEETFFTGEGLERCRSLISEGLGSLARFAPAALSRADARWVARQGVLRYAEHAVRDASAIEPAYILDFEASRWVTRSKRQMSVE